MILVALAVITLNACEEKGQEVTPVPDEIIGTWTATEATTIITYQGMSAYDYWISQGLTPDEATYQVGYQTRGHGDYIPIIIEFKTDGTFNTLMGAVGDNPGSPLTGTWEGTWDLNADRTILTLDDFDMPILVLSKNELTIQLVFDSNEYTMEDMTYDITISYTK